MRRISLLSSRLTLASLLSFALCGAFTFSAIQANAQTSTDKMKSGKMKSDKMKSTKMMDDHSHMSSMSEEDEEDLIPVAPSYPRVSPGGVALWHWTDYRHMHMAPGSAMEMKAEKMGMKDREHMANTMEEEEGEALPMAPAYPYAAPGSLNLYHWTDYRAKHMTEGSAMDSKMEMMDKKDKMMKKDKMKK